MCVCMHSETVGSSGYFQIHLAISETREHFVPNKSIPMPPSHAVFLEPQLYGLCLEAAITKKVNWAEYNAVLKKLSDLRQCATCS